MAMPLARTLTSIWDDQRAQIDAAIQFAEESPYPPKENLMKDIYTVTVGGAQ